MIVPNPRSIHVADHDDNSVTSTISVDGKTEIRLVTRNERKRVHFDISSNKEHENNTICKEDARQLWYKPAEYKLFRQSTMAAIKALAQTEAKNKAPFSYERVLERTYELCKKVKNESRDSYSTLSTVRERRHLERWAQVAPHRIGLDKWALRSMAKDKSRRRIEIVDVVIDMQECKPEPSSSRDEAIRRACLEVSRPSRMFAAAMAQAQIQMLSCRK